VTGDTAEIRAAALDRKRTKGVKEYEEV